MKSSKASSEVRRKRKRWPGGIAPYNAVETTDNINIAIKPFRVLGLRPPPPGNSSPHSRVDLRFCELPLRSTA